MTHLVALTAALFASVVLLRYAVRVPRDYPFRTMLLLVALATVAGLGQAVTWRAQAMLRREDATPAATAAGARDRWLAARPADSLASYVAPYPGATSARAAASRGPAAGATGPEGGRWTLATDDAPPQVIAHYRAAGPAAGWAVEVSDADFLVLRRDVRAADATGAERLRVRARRNPHGGGARTLVEHELARSF